MASAEDKQRFWLLIPPDIEAVYGYMELMLDLMDETHLEKLFAALEDDLFNPGPFREDRYAYHDPPGGEVG